MQEYSCHTEWCESPFLPRCSHRPATPGMCPFLPKCSHRPPVAVNALCVAASKLDKGYSIASVSSKSGTTNKANICMIPAQILMVPA